MSLTALIINPDGYKRMLLKQATTLMPELQRVLQASSFREAVARIENLEWSCDIIFVASDLDVAESEEFIDRCLALRQSQDAAFIVVMDSKDQSVGNVAQSLLNGANGILIAPFCVEDLSSIIEIAAIVKKQRSSARAKQALRILLDDIINKLDVIWYNYCNAQPAGLAIKDLKAASGVLRRLNEEELLLYFELAQEMFGELPIPPIIPKKVGNYAGASSRVRKLVEMQKKSFASSEEENGGQE